MLERCCGWQTCCCLELLDQLPAVKGVEQIDIAGTAVEYFEWEFTFLHVYA